MLSRWKVRAPLQEAGPFQIPGLLCFWRRCCTLLHKQIFLWNQGSACNEQAATVLIIFGIYIPPLIPKLPRTTTDTCTAHCTTVQTKDVLVSVTRRNLIFLKKAPKTSNAACHHCLQSGQELGRASANQTGSWISRGNLRLWHRIFFNYRSSS